MPTYYSPKGNPEIWEEKPHGYLILEEWEMTLPPLPGPPEPTLTEARTSKLSDIKSGYEAALIATLTMPASPENAPSSAETAAQAALFAVEDSAGLADVLAILSDRRLELEDIVNAAQTMEDVQAVAVSYPV